MLFLIDTVVICYKNGEGPGRGTLGIQLINKCMQ